MRFKELTMNPIIITASPFPSEHHSFQNSEYKIYLTTIKCALFWRKITSASKHHAINRNMGSGSQKYSYESYPYSAPKPGQANDLRKLQGDFLIENPMLGMLCQNGPSLLIHDVMNIPNNGFSLKKPPRISTSFIYFVKNAYKPVTTE
jgi:hypothetical protein